MMASVLFIGAPGEIRTPDPLVRSWHHENRALILLTNSAWRPLHLALQRTTEHNQTRKSPANTWLYANRIVDSTPAYDYNGNGRFPDPLLLLKVDGLYAVVEKESERLVSTHHGL